MMIRFRKITHEVAVVDTHQTRSVNVTRQDKTRVIIVPGAYVDSGPNTQQRHTSTPQGGRVPLEGLAGLTANQPPVRTLWESVKSGACTSTLGAGVGTIAGGLVGGPGGAAVGAWAGGALSGVCTFIVQFCHLASAVARDELIEDVAHVAEDFRRSGPRGIDAADRANLRLFKLTCQGVGGGANRVFEEFELALNQAGVRL